MHGTYASGGRDETAAGRVILMITSALAAVLVVAGLIYAAGTGQRHQAALATAGCEPSLSPAGEPCTTKQMLVNHFMTIVTPVNQQVTADVAAYTASEMRSLTGAEAALTAEVAVDKAFASSLAGIDFPPAIAPMAKTLAQANQVRAQLTAEQARSSSPAELRSFDQRVQTANATVESDMRLVLKALQAS